MKIKTICTTYDDKDALRDCNVSIEIILNRALNYEIDAFDALRQLRNIIDLKNDLGL